jgi:hypothetical protein
MVFKPDPIQARVPGFDRVTGSARSIPIFKKIQNGVVLVKKKQKSTGCNQVFDRINRVARSYQIIAYSIFSLTQSNFIPELVRF